MRITVSYDTLFCFIATHFISSAACHWPWTFLAWMNVKNDHIECQCFFVFWSLSYVKYNNNTYVCTT